MKLRPLPARKVIHALQKIGFEPVRQKGSHIILKNDEGTIIVVPEHSGEEIGRGLLLKIIKQAGVSKEKFMELLEK